MSSRTGAPDPKVTETEDKVKAFKVFRKELDRDFTKINADIEQVKSKIRSRIEQSGSKGAFLSVETEYYLEMLSFDCTTFNNFLAQEFIKIEAER